MSKTAHKSVKEKLVFLLFILGLIVILLVSLVNLKIYFSKEKVLGAKVENTKEEEIKKKEYFWQDFVFQNPNYFTGWIELAKLENELENRISSIEAYNEAKRIKPNSPYVKELEELLEISN